MNSISPNLWGRHLWDLLHWITFNYCGDDLILQNIIILHIPNLIPCKSCKENYLNHIKHYPPDFTSRITLSKWMVKMHNLTNKLLNKKTMSYDKVKIKYVSEVGRKRVKRSFLKWNEIMRHCTNNSSPAIQRSYSEFITYLFNNM